MVEKYECSECQCDLSHCECCRPKKFIVLKGIEHNNRFYSTYDPQIDQTKLNSGEIVYKILGYADSSDEALKIISNSITKDFIHEF